MTRSAVISSIVYVATTSRTTGLGLITRVSSSEFVRKFVSNFIRDGDTNEVTYFSTEIVNSFPSFFHQFLNKAGKTVAIPMKQVLASWCDSKLPCSVILSIGTISYFFEENFIKYTMLSRNSDKI